MDATSPSLLQKAREGSEPAWVKIVDLYRPLIVQWLTRNGVGDHDADDLSQDILATIVKELPDFVSNGRTGAFRTWLRVIAVNRARLFWRSRPPTSPSRDDSGLQQMAERLEDPTSDLRDEWDREHDAFVVRRLLEMMEAEFEPTTLLAFRRQTLDGVPAADVAHELGMTVGAVYVAKSRILRRLREEGEGLLD